MNKFLRICWKIVATLVSASFAFLPECLFSTYKLFTNISDVATIITNRLIFIVCIIIVSSIITLVYMAIRFKIKIKGKNYIIQVEYGDILKKKNCKKIIGFDECFTDTVGNSVSDIKATSICGQYLLKNPNINIQKLISDVKLKKSKTNSKFRSKARYDSGKLIPNGDDLLLAFARLDKDGRGVFFLYQEFLDCLSVLWKEIDKYYEQKDVCIPILGSGLTRISDKELTQQELLDIIILSYKLSTHKIKKPYKLRIICKKNDEFSLNKINEI